MELTTLEIWLSIIATALAILSVVFAGGRRWVWLPVKARVLRVIAWVEGVDTALAQISTLVQSTEDVWKAVTDIRKEMRANSGTSLRDAVTEIRKQVLSDNQRSRLLIDTMTVGVFETDADGKRTWVNKTYCDMVGVQREDALGKNWINAVVPLERHIVQKEWDEAVAAKRIFLMQYDILTSEGHRVTVWCQAWPILTAADTLHGYLGLISPVVVKRPDQPCSGNDC